MTHTLKQTRYNGKRNRPVIMQVRTDEAERTGMERAASIVGIPVSAWARERLRTIAVRELRDAGLEVPFLPAAGIERGDAA